MCIRDSVKNGLPEEDYPDYEKKDADEQQNKIKAVVACRSAPEREAEKSYPEDPADQCALMVTKHPAQCNRK